MQDKTFFLDLLVKINAVLNGHFRYSPELHGSVFLDTEIIFLPEHRDTLRKFLDAIIARFSPERDQQFELVVGPDNGGGKMADFLVGRLSEITGRDVPAIRAHRRPEEGFIIYPEDADVIKGRRVLVVDDVVTTGNSLKKTMALVALASGLICGTAAMINRSGKDGAELGLPNFFAPLNLDLPTCEPGPETCDLCAAGAPLTDKPAHAGG